MSSATADRIADEALHLFFERGYRGTSIAAIERATGLTPGAGGVYHHFATKEALLEAGLTRHLRRRASLAEIGRILPLGDLRAELKLIARWSLSELDREAGLLRLLTADARWGPERLRGVAEELVARSLEGFAEWLAGRQTRAEAAAAAHGVAVIGLTGLVASRLLPEVLGVAYPLDDEALVDSWVDMVAGALERPPGVG